MTKIPVLDTIRAAYRFTFTHLGAIIGLIWLPMILATVMGFFVMQRFFVALADAFASNNFARMGPALLGLISFVLVALLLLAMMSVPVMQLALGSRKQGALAHFAFGPQEWRLFRAGLGVAGFLFALLVIVSMGTTALLGMGTVNANLASLGLFYVCLIFFILRFGFFLPVVAVVESGPVLPRSWLMSAGNFWRIFGDFPGCGGAGPAGDADRRAGADGTAHSGAGTAGFDRDDGGPDSRRQPEHAGDGGSAVPGGAGAAGPDPGRRRACLSGAGERTG